jgi:hypothetical protein
LWQADSDAAAVWQVPMWQAEIWQKENAAGSNVEERRFSAA